MAASQLAWSASAAVAPLLYSALLDRGSLAAWGGPILICVVWALLIEILAHRMPQVGRPVTNVAEVGPDLTGVPPDPARTSAVARDADG
jgi:hypothetical protein